MLKKSVWNITFMVSLGSLKYLRNDRSVTKTPGPVKAPTPLVPGLIAEGFAKAAGLNHWPGAVGSSDTPATLLARLPFTVVPPSEEFARMVIGGPDWARVMPLNSQPPSAVPTNPPRRRNKGDA